MSTFFLIASFVMGLLFGSFANALAYRYPTGESLWTRSHCTSCYKMITVWENIPVISWLFLRGKCSGCKQPISARYPAVELFVALAFYLLASVALKLTPSIELAIPVALMFMAFAFFGTVLSLIDIDTRKLPANLVYLMFILMLANAIVILELTADSSRFVTALLSMAAFSTVYFVLWFVKPGAMGYGDVRLAGPVGFILGFMGVEISLWGFFLAFALATVYSIPGLVKKKDNLKKVIPFGPWMIAGALVAIICADIIVNEYSRLGGVV